MLRNRPFHCAAISLFLMTAGSYCHGQKPKNEPTFAVPGSAPAPAPGGASAAKPGSPAKPDAKKPEPKEPKERKPAKLDILSLIHI